MDHFAQFSLHNLGQKSNDSRTCATFLEQIFCEIDYVKLDHVGLVTFYLYLVSIFDILVKSKAWEFIWYDISVERTQI